MDDVSTLVARQYSAFAYPQPVLDLDEWSAKGFGEAGDPRLFAAMIWPEGRPQKQLNILVAGCGTRQAAVLAYSNRDCLVTGVDLSEPSLAHVRYLQDKHKLSNLQLYKGDLRELAKLGRTFDYIVCTGVIHHMERPVEGLVALRSVLNPGGVLLLMVYARHKRAGVYLLQDVFRRLGITQSAEGVEFVRSTIKALPASHYVHAYMRDAHDLAHESGIVDTFLHPQDTAYTVPEVLSLIEGNGLIFQGWIDNAYYFPVVFPVGSPLRTAIERLPPREQWAITEELTLLEGRHAFFARRSDCPHRLFDIRFDNDDWPSLVPVRRWNSRLLEPAQTNPRKDAVFTRPQHKFTLTPEGASIYAMADGRKTIADIHRAVAAGSFSRDGMRAFFESMWKRGHLLFSRVPVAAPTG